jgi:uncharacterized protein (DUF488 family)
VEIFTIGFTQTSAADFFQRLRTAEIRRLIDVRLNNSSQLAGFAKRDDLNYFLRELCAAEYVHEPLLTPTQDMLDAYKKRRNVWPDYQRRYLDLLNERKIESQLGRALFATPTVLLCSEAEATYCHRRLVIEYLNQFWHDLQPKHL